MLAPPDSEAMDSMKVQGHVAVIEATLSALCADGRLPSNIPQVILKALQQGIEMTVSRSNDEHKKFVEELTDAYLKGAEASIKSIFSGEHWRS